jgi:hypothetical protein
VGHEYVARKFKKKVGQNLGESRLAIQLSPLNVIDLESLLHVRVLPINAFWAQKP